MSLSAAEQRRETSVEHLEHLKGWIGRQEFDLDQVTVPAIQRLAATLDRGDPAPREGDPIPKGWHLIFFPKVARQSQLGPDGHPQRGDFLPAVPLPRRMGAGRKVSFVGDLLVGDELHRKSEIIAVDIKQSRNGPLVIVTVSTEISSCRGLAIVEEQKIAYRSEPSADAVPAPAQAAPGQAIWTREISLDTAMSFRFSALSFNTHRIHYDYVYATRSEGYEDVVIPGNLPTIMLFELMRANGRDQAPALKTAQWRNTRPIFANTSVMLCGEPHASAQTAKLWVMDRNGYLALTMDAEFA